MGKAVLISIRPEWVEKILPGEKTLEIRKNRPNMETPFKVISTAQIAALQWGCGGNTGRLLGSSCVTRSHG